MNSGKIFLSFFFISLVFFLVFNMQMASSQMVGLEPMIANPAIVSVDLAPKVVHFIDTLNSKLGADYIQVTDGKMVHVVTAENKAQTLNLIVENSQFFYISGNKGFITSIGQHQMEVHLKKYLDEIADPQPWPFAGGSSVELVQPGDQLVEISWALKAGAEFKTYALLDEDYKTKFEPLMYFAQETVSVHGSRYILDVTNFLGWTVVHAELSANINADQYDCEILTRENLIPIISLRTAPIWYAESIEQGQIMNEGECYDEDNNSIIQNKNFQCADARSIVAYSAYFPNWNISPTEFEITRGDLPMAIGKETLITEVVCAPEFPFGVLTFVIAISGFVVLMRSRSFSSLLSK